MFGNESANLPAGGSKTVEPSTDLDNPENLNFWEPGDEEEVAEANPNKEEEGIESETDEASEEDGQESDAPDDEQEPDPEAEPKEKEDAVVITLKGGEQVPLEELKLGYMRERDYRQKTMETGNQRRTLDEMTARVTRTVDAFASHLAGMLPDEPQPALAISNPNEYVRQKAMYDSALAQVNRIIEMANEPKDVAKKLTEQQEEELLSSEDAKLAEAFPQTRKSPEERKKFFDEAFKTAVDLGFTEQELKGNIDHRYFKLAYWAKKGLEAEKAKTKAMTKVNNAPPAVANGKSKGPASQTVRSNQDAMKKLSRTGSIRDAMAIDFE